MVRFRKKHGVERCQNCYRVLPGWAESGFCSELCRVHYLRRKNDMGDD